MLIFIDVILIIVAVFLMFQEDKRYKLAGKIILGIVILPIIVVILFFLTCFVMLAGGNIGSIFK